MAKFDGLHVWLGIPPSEQPPNHYRLLGIPLFESNADVIDNAGESRQLKLKSVQNGPHAKLSQQLLNEVTAAQSCLLTADQKAEYDARLAKQLEAAKQGATAPTSAPVAPVIVAAEKKVVRATSPGRKKKSPAVSTNLVKILMVGATVLLIVVFLIVAFVLNGDAPSEPSDADSELAAAGPKTQEMTDSNQADSEDASSPSAASDQTSSDAALEDPVTKSADATDKPAPSTQADEGNKDNGPDIGTTAKPEQGTADTAPDNAPEGAATPIEDNAKQEEPTAPPVTSVTERDPSTPAVEEATSQGKAKSEDEIALPQIDEADRKQLDKGIKRFKDDMQKHKRNVLALFDKSQATARRLGKQDEVQRLTEARWRFETLGEIPTNAPQALLRQQQKSMSGLGLVYQSIVRELLKEGRNESATAVEAEFQSSLRSVWNELLVNSSCEAPLANGEIVGWRTTAGAWNQAKRLGAAHAKHYFAPAPVPYAVLEQEVDVRTLAPQIQNGEMSFQIRADLHTYNQNPPDTCQVIVEFLDDSKQDLGGRYDSGQKAPIQGWKRVSETIKPPPKTAWVRVKLVSKRHARGTRNNDAIYDLVSLTAVKDKP